MYLRLGTEHDDEQDAKVEALEDAGHPVVRIPVDSVYDLGAGVLPLGVRDRRRGLDHRHQPVRPARRRRRARSPTRDLTERLRADRVSSPSGAAFFDGDGFRLFADDENAGDLRGVAGETASLDGYLAAQLGRVEPGDYFALLGLPRR